MFCWPCIIVYQYDETSLMHFSFNLLRIKCLYMFRALLSHPQKVLNKLQSWHSQLTYARNIPSAVCSEPPEDEQVRLETCRGTWFSINWIKIASRWFHHTDNLACDKDRWWAQAQGRTSNFLTTCATTGFLRSNTSLQNLRPYFSMQSCT
jgi:hypothetical protein